MDKVFIKTFGCQSNYGDSETLAGLLYNKGFQIVNDLNEANLVIVNSCGVKGITQNRVLSFVNSISKTKKVYVGGCLTSMINIEKYCKDITGHFNTNSIIKFSDILKEKEKIKIYSREKESRILKPVIRKDQELAIMNISQGCLNNCSFCSTKLSRGILRSYEVKDIVKAVEDSVKSGCKKIYLSSQDNGCYGLDIGTNLPSLLKEIVKIPGNFEVRVGMGNPRFLPRFLDELIEVYKNDKVMKFLHIPIQSGSNKILKEMKRGNTVEDFIKIIKVFRKEIPGMSIATDIIIGYPTETEEDFQETLKLIDDIKPEVLNISKYGKRPGTFAAGLKQLPSQEIKRRSLILTKKYKEIRKILFNLAD